jgi:mannose-6-phosphate isomerase-like protein (cupin superfamily)
MNLYYRSFTENHEVISYGRQVNEVFFISSGRVQVSFDADNDLESENIRKKLANKIYDKKFSFQEGIVFYLPIYSIFGDY